MAHSLSRAPKDGVTRPNDPQPALSVKVHAATPESLYRALGRFYFTPGHSTPSLFCDDTMFESLVASRILYTTLRSMIR